MYRIFTIQRVRRMDASLITGAYGSVLVNKATSLSHALMLLTVSTSNKENSKKPLYLSKEKVVKPPIDIIDQKNLMFLSDREERDVLLDKKVRNKIMSSGDDKLKRF